jgi:DNA-binding PadR family transcriptional regulator
LIEEGLLEESSERPDPSLDDARRRYYRLTKLGKQVLAAESERLEDLVKVVRAKRRLAEA